MDYYTKFTSKGLVVNTFLSLREKQYKWGDIASAKIYATISKTDRGKKNFNPKFEVTARNGVKVTIWDSVGWGSPSARELMKIIELLKSHGVMVNVGPLTTEQEEALSGYNQKVISDVRSIFNYFHGR
jgi:hypothetical protein